MKRGCNFGNIFATKVVGGSSMKHDTIPSDSLLVLRRPCGNCIRGFSSMRFKILVGGSVIFSLRCECECFWQSFLAWIVIVYQSRDQVFTSQKNFNIISKY